jgi:predicted P-loop ATPase
VDTDWLEENRDAIWAAVHVLALAGEPHWLTDGQEVKADKVREQYTEVDAWHESIAAACRGQQWVRAPSIYTDVLDKGAGSLERLDRKTLLRITATLKRLGCVKSLVEDRGQRVRAWVVPEELRSQTAARTMARVVALHSAK